MVIYARVSTEEQARSGFSLAEQLRACREHGARLAEKADLQAFTDDTSGEVLERPGLQAALAEVRAGRADLFLCLDPDRLARRLIHQLVVTEAIERSGCRLEFVQHQYQETPEGRLFYQLRGAIAEFEKAKILERMARGQRGKVAAGGLPHHIRMYGYRFQKGAGKQARAAEVLTPEPGESVWVRQIFTWCGQEGVGPAAIAHRLNALGVPTKTGQGRWRAVQVRRILRQDAYATGQLAWGRWDHRGVAVARRLPGRRQGDGAGVRPKPRPRAEWRYLQIEPLVERELWEAAQAVLGPAGSPRPAAPGDRLLAGLGRCALCGGNLHYVGGTKITCANRQAGGCRLPAKSRQAVERAVWEGLARRLLDPALLQGERTGDRVQRDEPELLVAERAAREAELERLGLLYARGLWSEERALAAMARVREQIGALNDRLADLADQLAVPDDRPATLAGAAGAALAALSAERRTLLLRTALERFELAPSERGAPPVICLRFRGEGCPETCSCDSVSSP